MRWVYEGLDIHGNRRSVFTTEGPRCSPPAEFFGAAIVRWQESAEPDERDLKVAAMVYGHGDVRRVPIRACFCTGACYTSRGCNVYPTGCRNPDDPWGPLLEAPARPDLPTVENPHSSLMGFPAST